MYYYRKFYFKFIGLVFSRILYLDKVMKSVYNKVWILKRSKYIK